MLYHADRIGGMLKTLSPGLVKYKALPADGLHPARPLMFFGSLNLQVRFHDCSVPLWLYAWRSAWDSSSACYLFPRQQGSLSLPLQVWFATGSEGDKCTDLECMSNAFAATSPGCLSKYPATADKWRCLLTNEILPHVKTPLFAVQQLMCGTANDELDFHCLVTALSLPFHSRVTALSLLFHSLATALSLPCHWCLSTALSLPTRLSLRSVWDAKCGVLDGLVTAGGAAGASTPVKIKDRL